VSLKCVVDVVFQPPHPQRDACLLLKFDSIEIRKALCEIFCRVGDRPYEGYVWRVVWGLLAGDMNWWGGF
jgi:hypothetical protein